MELAGRDGRLACSLIWTGFKRWVLTNWSAYGAYRSAHEALVGFVCYEESRYHLALRQLHRVLEHVYIERE